MLIGINIINWLELKFRRKWLPYCTIAVIALIAYCNSFTVPFALDDFGSISNNYAIHKLFDFVELWKFYANRIVLYFTLSVNYAIHDNGVEGYHITNLLLHIFNGILFYWILKRLFSLPYFKGKLLSKYSTSISVIAAVLFVCHPLQVNAVTYIVQRTASLAATFYMLAILFFMKYRMQNRFIHLLLTFLFTVTAMFTKENTITIPFMLLLIECMFFLKDGKTSWYKRIAIFILLFATVPIIPGTNLLLKGYSQSDPNVSFKASTSMDRFQYFFTELNVILLYIRLLFVPVNQNFDYSNDFPLSPTIWDNYSYVSFIILLCIGLFSLLTIKRNRLVSFGILWFFAGLAVESSFISIKDVYFEHRLYFPIAGFIMFLIGMILFERKPVKGEEIPPDLGDIPQEDVSVALDQKDVSVVSDQEGTSIVLDQEGISVLQEYEEDPVSLDQANFTAIPGLEEVPNVSDHQGIAFIPGQQTVSIAPGSGEFPDTRASGKSYRIRYWLKSPLSILLIVSVILIPLYTGLTLRRNYIYGDSIRLWSDVVKKAPGSDRAHSVLATGYLNAYNEEKKNTEYLDLAELEFKKAIDLYYYNSTAHCNLSKVYLLKEEYEKCIDEAKRTLSMTKSEYAQFNLGSAYKKQGKIEEALDAYLAGYEYNSRSGFILKALGETYFESGDYVNAKKYYEEYLEINKRFNNSDVEEKLQEIEKKLQEADQEIHTGN